MRPVLKRPLKLKHLALAAALVASSGMAQAALLLSEGFNTGIPATWFVLNQSTEVTGPGWFAGSGGPDHFPAQAGAPNAYAASSVFVGGVNSSGDPVGMVDAYLVSPSFSLASPVVLTFYTRTISGNAFGESLGVYAMVDGNFLPWVMVNDNGLSNPVAGLYPETWTQYTATLPGLGGTTTANLVFNYFIPNSATAGNYIGLDTVAINSLPVSVPEPGAWLGAAALLLALGMSRRKG